MTVSSHKSHRWWPYMISFLLIGSMGSILFGGVKGMLEFRKSMEPNLSINLENIRFFTKEYLQRLYQEMTVSEIPDETNLPSFYIYADESEFESLDSDLPASGKTQYRQGHLKVDRPGFSSEMQFRYRGGLPLHWLYKKKSFRVKLPPYVTYRNERQFNLVNPSTISTVTDWVSYDLARSIGLLTPEYFPARLYINNISNGLHFYLSRIDESFLRKNKRMPGSIYSGDTIYIPNPFGEDEDGMNEVSFTDTDSGIALMWTNQSLWEKDASRNAQSRSDRRDISKFVEIINQSDPLKFVQDYETYFDKEKYNLFWSLDTLVGGFHHDLYHNHKMYFDPYKGKFEPIEWDIRFWTTAMPIPENPLLQKIRLNPMLEFERDATTYKLWKQFPVEDIVSRIDKTSQELIEELKADPFRQHPNSNIQQFELDKVVPFSISDFSLAIEDLKITYEKRHDRVKNALDYSSTEYTLEAVGDKQVGIKISVTGNSPVDVNLWAIVPESMHSEVEIVRLYQDSEWSIDSSGIEERLYPGRTIKPGNVLGRADLWSTLTFGKEHIVPAPLHYEFIVKGLDVNDLVRLKEWSVVNSITKTPHSLKLVAELPSSNETKSVHPWMLLSKLNSPLKNVILSGEIVVTEDLVFAKNQQVTILPGTIFRLGKDRSLVFFGRVNALGTEAEPIQFVRNLEGVSWGSIVIQGEGASGSHLSHIQVSGGSLATHQLIDYPGQINIHDVEVFKLEHCLIKDNAVGDDALHIAYSKGEVINCRFENTAFDALDMDIVQVSVSDSQFYDIGNDALDLMTSIVNVNNVLIDGAGDKCFSVGEESEVYIQDSNLNNCLTGIAVKDKSTANVENIKFNGIKQKAIALYRKNPRYSVGGKIRGKQIHGITISDLSVSESSTSFLSGESFLSGLDK